MQTQMQETMQSFLFTRESPYLVLQVHRDNLIQDTLRQVFFVSLFLCFFVSLFLCFFVSLFLCLFILFFLFNRMDFTSIAKKSLSEVILSFSFFFFLFLSFSFFFFLFLSFSFFFFLFLSFSFFFFL